MHIGIGLAFTKLSLASGAKVIIADLVLSPPAELLISDDPNARFIRCDVGKWNELESLIPFSQKEFGDVPDVYAANAGVGEPVFAILLPDSYLRIPAKF
jgi:NAD(P)-dependent dehydrogenase (short-subunit alcohol dehydrogenase family)